MITRFLIKSAIFSSVCWVVIMALTMKSTLSVNLPALALASCVGFVNSLIGVLVAQLAMNIASFAKIVAIGQLVRGVVVIGITVIIMAFDLVEKVNYVLGFILFIPTYTIVEVWGYYENFKKIKKAN